MFTLNFFPMSKMTFCGSPSSKIAPTVMPNFVSAILDSEANSLLHCILNDVFSSETETKASTAVAGF